MTTRLKIAGCRVSNGSLLLPVREVMTEEDGLQVVEAPYCWVVEVFTPCGELYVHRSDFPWSAAGKVKADALAARVAAAGDIDPDHWDYVRDMYGSQAWVEGGHEERQIEDEKMGLG